MHDMLPIDHNVAVLQAAGMPAHVTNKFRANADRTRAYSDPTDVLAYSFFWACSPEGHKYWQRWYYKFLAALSIKLAATG